MKERPAYLRYWGKADPSFEGERKWHPFAYHSLDVAAVSAAFWVADPAVRRSGVRTHIPIGSVACIMLEPGTRVSHRAAALAARVATLLVWVGEAGGRLYASGQPGGARSDRLLYQAKLALDDQAKLKVVRKMYEMRFGEKPPERRRVEQLCAASKAQGSKKPTTTWPSASASRRQRRSQPLLSAATACLYANEPS